MNAAPVRADAVQHAEGGDKLEKRGALELGQRRLLLVRALRVGPERVVGRGRAVEHRERGRGRGGVLWLAKAWRQSIPKA